MGICSYSNNRLTFTDSYNLKLVKGIKYSIYTGTNFIDTKILPGFTIESETTSNSKTINLGEVYDNNKEFKLAIEFLNEDGECLIRKEVSNVPQNN